MRKHKKAMLWSLAVLLLVIIALLLAARTPRPNQPVYKGLSLAQWLDVVDQHRVNGYFTTYQEGRPPSRNATPQEIHEAEEAVRAIGTNALPSLLGWISYRGSTPKRFYRGVLDLLPLPDHIRGFLWGLPGTRPETLAGLAVQGFRVLNTNALPALGVLSKLSNDTNNIPAAKALFAITNATAH